MDKGRDAGFCRRSGSPPSSTWEIINPREYEKAKVPVVPLMPDIHPIVDKTYKAYDIGQVGELDVHILAALFGGENAARDLTPCMGRRHLLGGTTAERDHAGRTGQHQVNFAFLLVGLEKRRIRAGLCRALRQRAGA